MGWEISFLLGFLILFSVSVSFPLDEQYFFVDLHGIKHYVLTPIILDSNNSVDDLTNVLFTKYEDPWDTSYIFTISYLTLFFVSLYLLLTTHHTRSIVFSKLKIKNSYFSNKKLLLDFWVNNVSSTLKPVKMIIVPSIHSKTFTKSIAFCFSILFISLAFSQTPLAFANHPNANVTESISFIDTLTKKLFLNPSDSPIIVDSNFMSANITGTTILTTEIVDIGTITISGTTTPIIFDYATFIQNSGNITTSLAFPNATGGSVSAQFTTVSKPTFEGRDLILIGETSNEIKNWDFTSSSICDNSCTITYNYNSTHAASAGINPLKVVIFMDSEEDGTFIELETTVVDNGDGTFTATALTFSSGTDSGVGVAAAVLSLSGGSGDRRPPSFIVSFDEDEYPISIQGKNFKLPLFENEIETIVLETGEPVEVVVQLYEDGGPSNIIYFVLYTNLEDNIVRGGSMDTSLIFQKGKETYIQDPDGLFSSVDLETSIVGNKFKLKFDIVFEKPMQTSDIILVSWDFKKASVQTTLLDAWEVVESGNATQAEVFDKEEIIETEEIVTPTSEITMPSWIKSNAGWWYEGTIDDEEFFKSIRYLITEEIITIPQTESGESSGNEIPFWIKDNAGWWADDEIDDETFVQAIQYLITNGILTA